MEFSRQGYQSGLPFPSLEDLSNPGIEPGSPGLQADCLSSEPPGKLTSTKGRPSDPQNLSGCWWWATWDFWQMLPAAGGLRGAFLWQPPYITWIPFPCWLLLLFVFRNSQGLWGMRMYDRRMKENSRATKMTNVGAWTWLQGQTGQHLEH